MGGDWGAVMGENFIASRGGAFSSAIRSNGPFDGVLPQCCIFLPVAVTGYAEKVSNHIIAIARPSLNNGEAEMKANEFLTAQEALWLAKVIFDQTYSVLNTSLQQRSDAVTAQHTTTAKPKAARTRVVVMPSAKPSNPAPQKATPKTDSAKLPTKAIAPAAKPQQRSLAAIKPSKPYRPQ